MSPGRSRSGIGTTSSSAQRAPGCQRFVTPDRVGPRIRTPAARRLFGAAMKLPFVRCIALAAALVAAGVPATAQTFGARQFDAGPSAARLATGDFDGDGRLDVAAGGV